MYYMTLHYWQSLDNLENCLYNLYDNAFKIPQLYFVYVSGETNIRVSNGLIESYSGINSIAKSLVNTLNLW